jgi:cobalt-zinc-cadmium efflux system membrane fusion protein
MRTSNRIDLTNSINRSAMTTSNFILVGLSMLILTACGSDPEAGHDHDHGHSHGSSSKAVGDSASHSGELTLTAEQLASLDIPFTRPKFMSMEGSIRLSGKVMSSPLSKAEITSPIAAKVIDVLVDEGAHVKKGQALMQLSDVGFFQLQQEYLAARAKRTRARTELERQRTLVASDAAARKSLEQAQADADEWNATAASLEGQVRLLGLEPDQLDATDLHAYFTVRSPIEGRVNGIRIFLGSRVEPTTVLLEVLDLHHFHVHLNAYERDLGLLQEGRIFPFEVLNLPGKNFIGELFSIGRRFDEDGRSIPVHAHVEEGSEDLVEGMSVMAMIPTGDLRRLAVPEKAIARNGEEGFVYVDKGPGPDGEHHFLQVPVIPELTLNGFTAIRPLSPLDTTSTIAADAVFYLRNAVLVPGEGH